VPARSKRTCLRSSFLPTIYKASSGSRIPQEWPILRRTPGFQGYQRSTMGSTLAFSSSLESFLKEHQIQYHTQASSDYENLRTTFVVASGHPVIITRPKTAAEVAHLVQYLGSNKIPFSVRSGGHDMWGRTTLQDGVTVDMRELDHVSFSPDKKTATVGGGILSLKLLEGLAEHGLQYASS
jgi:FAD binding domain-containing protein